MSLRNRPRSEGLEIDLILLFVSRRNIVLLYFYLLWITVNLFHCAARLQLVLKNSLASAPEELMQGG